jgi:hypothetical protein
MKIMRELTYSSYSDEGKQIHAPAALLREEITPGTHWTGGEASPWTCLDRKAESNIPAIAGTWTSVIQPVV